MSTAVAEPTTKLNQLEQLKKFTKAVADTADTVHVVIPYAAAEGELSDSDLERVAGGKQDITANCLVLGGTAVSNTVMQLNL